MKIKISVLLVVPLLIFSLDLPSKERRGAELVVTKNDGQVLKGELIAVKQNSVLLLSPEGADVSVDIKDMDIIKIVNKSRGLKGAGIGLLAGALTGVIVGASVSVDVKRSVGSSGPFWLVCDWLAPSRCLQLNLARGNPLIYHRQ